MKKKRPTWFKIFLHQKAMIDSVDDATAGKALKAAMQYFETLEEPENMPQSAFIIFSTIKQYIYESFEDYEKKVEGGKTGAARRWGDR